MATVVLTRDAAGCARYALALAPLDVVSMPVTRAAPPADPAALARALDAGDFTAIAVASARAASALVDAGAGRAGSLPATYAVGPGTAAVLHAAGIVVHVPDGVRDAVSLATAMVAALGATGRVLVPRAEDGRDDGISILQAAGLEVLPITAYRTRPTPAADAALTAGRAALARGGVAVACALFAPSQVTALDALVGIRSLGALPFVAIGETTASALRAAGAAVIAVAARPTPEGLAGAVATVYPPR